MQHLVLRLFGPPRIERDGQPVMLNLRKGLALLAYLAFSARPHARDSLATLLWPEADAAAARGRLRRTVHEVNSTVGSELVIAQGDLLRLNSAADLWVDVEVFAAHLADGRPERLAAAAALYADDFLAGFGLADSPGFDEWQGLQREALRQTLATALERLAEHHGAAGAYDRAIGYALRQLGLDPLQEPVHRRLMELYARAGQPAAALRQYESCARMLEEELGVAPDAATVALYRSLASITAAPARSTEWPEDGAEIPEIRYVRTGGGYIAYQVFGRGPCDMLFLPGFVSHLEWAWREPELVAFFRRLGRSARVAMFDRRGIGLSDRTGSPPTPENTMEDACAVLDAAGMRRIVLYGCSEGGPTSAMFAARMPERVRALVLYAAMAKGSWSPDYPHMPTREQYDTWLARLAKHWGGPLDIEVFAPGRQHDEKLRRWWAALLRFGSSPAAMQVVLQALRDTDVRTVLPSIRVPTLVLHRKGERAIRVGAGRTLAAMIPGARFVELAGEDHWWWLGDYDALLREVEGFMQGLVEPSTSAGPRVLAAVLCIAAPRELLAGAVRDTIDGAGGKLGGPVEKLSMDTATAFFDTPSAALRCAQAIMTASAPASIRAALHIGELDARAGELTGPPVAHARTLLDAARPGEVLASELMRQLAASPDFVFMPAPDRPDAHLLHVRPG